MSGIRVRNALAKMGITSGRKVASAPAIPTPNKVNNLAYTGGIPDSLDVSFTVAYRNGIAGTPDTFSFRWNSGPITNDTQWNASVNASGDAAVEPMGWLGGSAVPYSQVGGLPLVDEDINIAIRFKNTGGGWGPISNVVLVHWQAP